MPNILRTIYQGLDRTINGGWKSKSVHSYDMNDMEPGDIIFRTNDPVEFEKKKLELQQQRFLSAAWQKANAESALDSMADLSNIKIMYRDCDLMDAFPEIGAALDIISEEACTVSDENKILNITSPSDRIKGTLDDLFVNRLDEQITLPMVARATCKYGNDFMLLNLHNKLGVLGWRRLPVYDMERYEFGMQSPYSYPAPQYASSIENNETTFRWIGKNEAVPYRNWQVAHFRLLTDSIFLPYGVSWLNKARRHWRMLALMEDMMLIYRLERSIERRVFKIFVGNIAPEDVPAYINEIANNFKRSPLVDPLTGQLDLRKNIMPVWKNTPIPLLDGRTITIEELAKEYEEGKKNEVYSIQDKTLQIVPGHVAWCGKNYCAETMIKVTLDDDSYVLTAPEHPFVLRDGSMKRADELKEGELLFGYDDDNNNRFTKSIEVVSGDDVYCMTVVGPNNEDDRHNFALLSFKQDGSWNESGCFVRNSVDQDFFIPVRSENAPNPIETLSAAQNLTAMDDIKYVQDKLLAGLQIPKTFLNFDKEVGHGKNLALMDIRFTRSVQRVQQALLMELNKIAMIHLYLLGFTDDLTNFTITMNNPSSQAEMLSLENLQKRVSILKDATGKTDIGIPGVSLKYALKKIMHMSESEIKEMFNEIRLESALAVELQKTPEIIKRTGIFDEVDNLFGEPGAQYSEGVPGEGGDFAGDSGGGADFGGPIGGGGGADFGSDIDTLGDVGTNEEGEIQGEEGNQPLGGENTPEPSNESVAKELIDKAILNEQKKIVKRVTERKNKFREKYLSNIGHEDSARVPLIDENFLINEDINALAKDLDKYLTENPDDEYINKTIILEPLNEEKND